MNQRKLVLSLIWGCYLYSFDPPVEATKMLFLKSDFKGNVLYSKWQVTYYREINICFSQSALSVYVQELIQNLSTLKYFLHPFCQFS